MPSLFILAGEASGDRIGAKLVDGIKRRRPDIGVIGVGGEALAEAGVSSLFAMDDLAVMGYRDVIRRLPLLLWRARQVVRHILRHQPDVVVLIDAQVFSKVVATRLRRRGYRGRIVLYVAPAVWAWGAGRARALAGIFDEVLSVLPFEPAAMAQLGGPETAYVGHPAISLIEMRARGPAHGPLLLLPGSRRSEIRKHLPLFADLAVEVSKHRAVDQLVILSTKAQFAFITEQVKAWPVAVSVVAESDARTNLMAEAVAAIAVSGTVTLELALAGVPHILTYIAEAAQVRLFQKATTPYIGLPNIIAKKAVVPEILFSGRGKPEELGRAILDLLDAPKSREVQIAEFAAIRSLMEKGAPEAPLEDPVHRVLAHFPEC